MFFFYWIIFRKYYRITSAWIWGSFCWFILRGSNWIRQSLIVTLYHNWYLLFLSTNPFCGGGGHVTFYISLDNFTELQRNCIWNCPLGLLYIGKFKTSQRRRQSNIYIFFQFRRNRTIPLQPTKNLNFVRLGLDSGL